MKKTIDIKELREKINESENESDIGKELWRSRAIKCMFDYLEELSIIGVDKIDFEYITNYDNYHDINKFKIINGDFEGNSIITINNKNYDCKNISKENHLKIINNYKNYPAFDISKKDKNDKVIIEDKFMETIGYLFMYISCFSDELKKIYNEEYIIKLS